jgi:ADP-ribose pyrophosphatase
MAAKTKRAARSGRSAKAGCDVSKNSDLTATPPQSSSAEKPRKPNLRAKARIVSSVESYKGKVFSVFTDTVVEPGFDRANTRDVIRHNGSVVVLAIDNSRNPDDPDVLLIRQYRHAAGQFLLELPAGRIDPGEAPLAAAKREMIEETGFRARKWTLLTKYFASPGFLGEWMQIYLATDVRAGAATPEDDEHIEILPTPLSEAMELVATNKIHDGKTLIGLTLYNLARTSGRLS